MITAKIVKNGTILPANEFIAENQYASWMTRGYPCVGDVVMTTEAPLGEVAQLRDAHVALAQRIITIRGKNDVLDNGYLKYLQETFVQYAVDKCEVAPIQFVHQIFLSAFFSKAHTKNIHCQS